MLITFWNTKICSYFLVDKSDEKMPKAPEPPQEVKRTDDEATNLVTKDPALVISNDQKPLPVEKDIAGAFVTSTFVLNTNRGVLVQSKLWKMPNSNRLKSNRGEVS